MSPATAKEPNTRHGLAKRRWLQAIFNAAHPAAIIVVIFLNVALNTLAALLHDWISKGVLLGLAILALLVIAAVVWRAWRVAKQEVVVRAREVHVPKCRAVIMFLSFRRSKTPVSAWLEDPRFRGGLLDPAIPEIMDPPGARENWRMPVEGLKIHYPLLERVIVLTSRDFINRRTEEKDEGSYSQFEDFKKLIELLCQGLRRVEVEDLHGFLGGDKFEEGIDFENAGDLVSALVDVYARLHELKYKNDQIMVDVTGGQKVPTVAGAAVVLGKDQVFQYISTRDYTPRGYDVEYLGES
jgi:hypothetical protein